MDSIAQITTLSGVKQSRHFVKIVALAFYRLGSVSTFLLYAVLSLAGLWFCFRFVPETKGVPLERIESDLRAGRPLRELGKTR
jgi:hypothetical protein